MNSQNSKTQDFIVMPTNPPAAPDAGGGSQINQQARLEQVNDMNATLELLDQLHNAASEGQLAELTHMNKRELIAYLREVMYVAEQTIEELQADDARGQVAQQEPRPLLRILEKTG